MIDKLFTPYPKELISKNNFVEIIFNNITSNNRSENLENLEILSRQYDTFDYKIIQCGSYPRYYPILLFFDEKKVVRFRIQFGYDGFRVENWYESIRICPSEYIQNLRPLKSNYFKIFNDKINYENANESFEICPWFFLKESELFINEVPASRAITLIDEGIVKFEYFFDIKRVREIYDEYTISGKLNLVNCELFDVVIQHDWHNYK